MGRGMGGGRGGGGRGGRGGRASGGRAGGGRGGGPLAAGPGGDCICPQCGHREPHQVGQPCTQRRCPKCGAMMARE